MKLSKVPKELVEIWRKQYDNYVRYTTTDITWIEWLKKKYQIEED